MKLTLQRQNLTQVKTSHLFIAENERQYTAAPEVKHLGLAIFHFVNIHNLIYRRSKEEKYKVNKSSWTQFQPALSNRIYKLIFFNLDFQRLTKHFSSFYPNAPAFQQTVASVTI